MSGLVSVVIPCYNHAKYLHRAVDSVVAQTYGDIEIIIVNDGSTDNSADVARQLIEQYPDSRIELVEQERQGAPRARNAGIAASHGEYLLLLDVDDTIEPQMLAETVAEMSTDPECGIVYTYTRHRVDPDDPPREEMEDGEVQEYGDYDFADWVRRNPQLDACSLVRREAFEATGGFDPDQFAEDLDLWLGITKRGWRAKLIPKPLFNYWHHGGARESAESWMQPIELRWQLLHKHPELYDAGERLFVGSLMLGSMAADVVDIATTVAVSAETGLDWITVQTQASRLRDRFVELLSECEAVSDAKFSRTLADAVTALLGSCRQAEAALVGLADAVNERRLTEAIEEAEQLRTVLPRLGEEMVLVFQTGMPEIYGPAREGTERTH